MSQHTIGITGSKGFIGRHLVRRLEQEPNIHIVACSRDALQNPTALRDFVKECDTIIHLAAMNRGEDQDIYKTNLALVDHLVDALQACDATPHFILASSTQRDQDNAYGQSKRVCEQHLTDWTHRVGSSLSVLVIPNVYGPGCRPFYNSVVSTFCHQLAHGEQPIVHQDQTVNFIWINDLVEQIYQTIDQPPSGVQIRHLPTTAQLTIEQLLQKLQSFRNSYFDDQLIPDLSDPIDASLYVTFLSHVKLDDHCHEPVIHSDQRGRLFEILRLAGGGQILFSTTKPGVIRGNHFHTRKIEWFCVLRGDAVIRLRRVGDDEVHEFRVSGESPQFISIPVLHTHQIENVGNEELLTMFWCNEIFEAEDADTFYEDVA